MVSYYSLLCAYGLLDLNCCGMVWLLYGVYWSLFGSVVAGRRFHHRCSHFESKLGLDQASGLLSSGFFDVPGVNIIKSGLAGAKKTH